MTKLSAFFATALLAASALSSASAATVTYTSRAQFEAALATVHTDTLDGLPFGLFAGDLARTGYTITTPQIFGCAFEADCGDNSPRGIDYSGNGTAYLWNYSGTDTFTFDAAVNAFGFDFADPVCCSSGSRASIDGAESAATFGFFGVISDTTLFAFNIDSTGAFMVMDNITFGTIEAESPVPEPSLPELLGVGLLMLAAARARKQR